LEVYLKIESKDTDIESLLTGSFFHIPRFQRPYSWDDENISDFWNDLIINKDDDYFIGSMVVFKKSKQQFGVVDGQQRLTTITILLCVIRDQFSKLGNDDLAKGLHQLIERKDRDNKSEYVLKTETSYSILISLYALGARPESCISAPFRGFKSLPGSMPYGGAFTTHTEQVLVPHVAKIKTERDKIMASLRGEEAPAETGGDFSVVVYPLPKIALCYIFYEADEDFPASVTCLYSGNADCFMPVDGLADVGEYTSRKILALIEAE
jgi:hypothetical protein